MNKGKLIVIEGPDGSGKTEQWNLLAKKLKNKGYQVEQVDFPQYGRLSSGPLQAYLRGVPIKPDDVSPYVASTYYAIDRYDLSHKMNEWLAEGKIILANRYVASNGGHQGGKIKSQNERKLFLRWLFDLEYNKFCLPKPDVNVFLDLPVKISLKLIDKRGLEKDGHENKVHLMHAYYSYRDMIRLFPKDFMVIKSVKNGKLRSKEAIHDEIWEKVKEKLKL